MLIGDIAIENTIFSQFEGDRLLDAGASSLGVDLNEIKIHHDKMNKAMWCYLDQKGRSCFTFDLGNELESIQLAVEKYLYIHDDIQYFIFGSKTPGIFNLGGDLELFVENIRNKDIVMMKKYAKKSVDILYRNIKSFNSDIISIGLIQGNALGGGFEFALSFDILVAEKSTKFGLPEIIFNLFPGMGAYNFLFRKIGRKETEKMILSGKTYTGEQLYDLGVVDVLAEDGQGQSVVEDYIITNQKRFYAEKSIYDSRKTVDPITKEELMKITYNWAEIAMKLDDVDLRKMERLVNAQKRLAKKVV